MLTTTPTDWAAIAAEYEEWRTTSGETINYQIIQKLKRCRSSKICTK